MISIMNDGDCRLIEMWQWENERVLHRADKHRNEAWFEGSDRPGV